VGMCGGWGSHELTQRWVRAARRSISAACVSATSCVIVGSLVLTWARIDTANAAVFHRFDQPLSEKLSEGVPESAVLPSGGFSGPITGADAMGTTGGELWIAEKIEPGGNTRVDAFNPSTGEFVKQLEQVSGLTLTDQGLAIGGSPGESAVYVGVDGGQLGEVAVYDPVSGAFRSAWSGAHTPNGSFVKEAGSTVAELGGLAFDHSTSLSDWASGDLYVATRSRQPEEHQSYNVVYAFKPAAKGPEPAAPSGVIEGTCASLGECPGHVIRFRGPRAVAVSGVNGDVYVADTSVGLQTEPVVDVFEPTTPGSFQFIGTISGTPRGGFVAIRAIAVDGTTGDAYVVDEREGKQVVDEFSSTLDFEGQLTGPGTGGFTGVNSVAVDPTSENVFVGDGRRFQGAVDAFGPNVIVPAVRVTEPISVTSPSEVSVSGEVNPEGQGPATCVFEFGTTTGYGKSVPCSQGAVEGAGFVPVTATLAGLDSDTRYFYRLSATNANGTNQGLGPEDEGSFRTTGPGIHATYATEVANTSATLNARVNPNGASTKYYFEYGPTTTYGLTAPLAPGESLGAGESDVGVSHHVSALESATTYHFRVVAVSVLPSGVFELRGSDHTFTTQGPGASVLPDGRSWVKVSPGAKHGAVIQPQGYGWTTQAAAAGNAVSYVVNAPIEAEPVGYSNLTQVLSARQSSSAWASQELAIPHGEAATGQEVGEGEEYRYFSSDLSLAVLQPFGAYDPTLSSESSEQTPYLRRDFPTGEPAASCVVGCYKPMVTAKRGFADVPLGQPFGGETNGRCNRLKGVHPVACGPLFEGSTPDLSYSALGSYSPLTNMKANGSALYLWHQGAAIEAVSILPANEGGVLSAGQLGSGEEHGKTRVYQNAIATDGSRVVWSGKGHLFVRDMIKHETLRVDVKTGEEGGGEAGSAVFQGASSDDRRIYFLDGQQLTADAGAVSVEPDLYECEVVVVASRMECQLTDLSPKAGGMPAFVQGRVLGVSQDGERVYFVANGALAPGSSRGDCNSIDSESICNLYVSKHGTTRLVAVLSQQDENDWGAVGGETTRVTASVSASGDRLVFLSERELTGYDNHDARSAERDEELYSYDLESEGIVCVSCNPTGARPHGVEVGPNPHLVTPPQTWNANRWLAALVPPWTQLESEHSTYQTRYLGGNGRIFFDTPDALVPEDINGNWDVYEYEPAGVGDCKAGTPRYSARSAGCIALISGGQSPAESAFLDASESGDDVFFLTFAKLTTADVDNGPDVYDAQVCTTSAPCPPATPVSEGSECVSTDQCRGPAAPPSSLEAPASAQVTEEGDVSPATGSPASHRKPLTARQKLLKLLTACRRKHGARRRSCERAARKRYPQAAKALSADSRRKKT
jgi:hypothetical protein